MQLRTGAQDPAAINASITRTVQIGTGTNRARKKWQRFGTGSVPGARAGLTMVVPEFRHNMSILGTVPELFRGCPVAIATSFLAV